MKGIFLDISDMQKCFSTIAWMISTLTLAVCCTDMFAPPVPGAQDLALSASSSSDKNDLSPEICAFFLQHHWALAPWHSGLALIWQVYSVDRKYFCIPERLCRLISSKQYPVFNLVHFLTDEPSTASLTDQCQLHFMLSVIILLF